jgi:anti-sigma factor RsiW
MHQPVREELEDYLAGGTPPSNRFDQHLRECAECAVEVGVLREQAALVRVLRTDEEVEPAPGFYARVLNRIEQRVRPSIWSLLRDPSLGRRIAVASAALAFVVCAYIVSTEPFRMTPSAASTVAIQQLSREDTPVTVAQDRDVVLASLASFREN